VRHLTDGTPVGTRDPPEDDRKEMAMSTLTSRIELTFTEDGDRTRAHAILELPGQHFEGFGEARRAPGDPNVPVVGEELAAARALSELSHKLVQAAARRIEGFGT
jgi:uncharacterized protein DUF1876